MFSLKLLSYMIRNLWTVRIKYNLELFRIKRAKQKNVLRSKNKTDADRKHLHIEKCRTHIKSILLKRKSISM